MEIKKTLLLSATLTACVAFAQDVEVESAGDMELEGVPAVKKTEDVPVFRALPVCRFKEGIAEVRKPGSSDWAPIEEGKFYPLGCAYRTQNGRLTIEFGREASVKISGNASFTSVAMPLGAKSRGIVLGEGQLELSLADNIPEGAFTIASTGFSVKNPAGESRFILNKLGDGEMAIIRCVTGSLSIDGCHFSIPTMRAANEIKIRTSNDKLETILYGTSGDYIARLDRGLMYRDDIQDDGTVRKIVEQGSLDWHLSPATKVQINRAVPAIGKRMSVAVMTFDAVGEMKNHFAYAEGRAEVNTGELVRMKGAEAEAIAKKAAEATTEAEAVVTVPAEEKKPAADSDEEDF